MVQRAEWRRLPADPVSPLGWWLRETRGTLQIVRNVAVVATLLFAFAFFSGWFDVLFLEPLAIGFAIYGSRRLRKASLLPRLAALAPSPAPAECFPIELTVLQKGVPTGRDQGLASFVDGWLHVEGLRTSLSLRPVDIAKPQPLPDRDLLDIPGGQQVELRPLGTTQEDRDTFRETLRIWYRFPFGLPRGEPLLPPLSVHPSAVTRPLNLLFFLAMFSVLAIAVTLFFVQGRGAAQGLPFLIPSIVLTFRHTANALEDLRRLKNLHRQALDEKTAVALP